VLVGGDTLPVRKPDPLPLLHAARELGVAADDCIYVGDDERDIVAARNAGMKSVAALWGYRQAHEDPREWRPDACAEQPLHLLQRGILSA
jgi:phosphoglycolate phosphatase